MDCSSCGSANRAEASFCKACGATLVHVLTCASCGYRNDADSRFCEHCGQSLSAETPADRNRAVGPTTLLSGRYRIGRFLGEGAKKRVYLAHDERLGRDVVVGLIKTADLDESHSARVEAEARAMGRLGEHPHAVNIYDVGRENGQLYVVAQYIPGDDLERALNAAPEHRLPIDQAVSIALDVCEALGYSHAKGVIHRDVKPSNIYLGNDGAKLGDFGLALALDRSHITQDGMLVGTPSYMAPELALGRNADARSDLYALGATLYEMVTGRPPFTGDDPVAIISQHINTRPVAPGWHRADVPQALETLILQLLEKDVDDRPAGAEEVAQRLATLAESPPAVSNLAGQNTRVNPLDRLASGVFVGRGRELENLHSALERSLSGHGQLRMLVGEPGAGKTRTAQELATYAGLRAVRVLWGRCFEGEGAPPYWPWQQIIRNYVNKSETGSLASEMGPGAADIAELVPEVRELLPGLPIPTKLDSNQARFRLWNSITTFLCNVSNQQPLLLVLDDLHRADEPSLLLLQFLAREIAGHRILVVGTYRDVELRRQHPLSAVLAELSRERLFERVLLRGLGRDDVAQFIEGTTQARPAPELVDAVFRETEGNPFFTHEVVRLLAQEGRLDRSPGDASWSLAIPQGVREVVGHRLDALSEKCNALMAAASAFGREFELRALARVCEISEDEALERVEEALAAHLLAELPESVGRYQFAHALVQQTLYEEHSTARRVRLHQRIGEALEALHGRRLEEHLGALAYHFAEAAPGGNVDKAVEYAERAAHRAMQTLAHEDAVLHYRRALQALELGEAPDPLRRCDVLLDLAQAEFEAGRPGGSETSARAAADLARACGDPNRLARAAVIVGDVAAYQSFDSEVAPLLEDALDALPEDAVSARANVLASLAFFHQQHNDGRSDAESQEAVALALNGGDTETILRALSARHAITMGPGYSLDERQTLIEQLERYDPNFEVSRVVLGPSTRLHLLIAQGNGGVAANAVLEDMERRAAELRSEPGLLFARLLGAQLALLRGDFAACEQETRAILGSHRRGPGSGLVLGVLSGLIYGVHRERGRLDEIADQLDANIDRITDEQLPLYRGSRAALYAETGRLDDARVELRVALERGYLEPSPNLNWLGTLAFFGEACAAVDDEKTATLLFGVLEPYEDRNTQLGSSVWTPVSRILGLLAATLGQHDKADRYFEAALDMCQRLQSPPLRARTEVDYAEILHRRGKHADVRHVRELVSSALTIAEELGMNLLVQRAVKLKLDTDSIVSQSARSAIDSVGRRVADNRPNLEPHVTSDGTVTLLFSDIEDYTGLLDRLGDVAAHQLVQEHNGIVRAKTRTHGGNEVELRGDGFLLAFAEPAAALRCAIDLQRAFHERNATAAIPIRIRIGLHAGETIRDVDSFFGRSVIAAFRVADLAEGGEILVTDPIRASVDDSQFHFGSQREVTLKGFHGAQTLFPVCWEE